MKTFSIFTTLFFIASMTFAQTSTQVVAVNTSNSETTEELADRHGQIAVKQISACVKKHFKYPASIKNFGFNGELILQVMLSKDGAVTSSSIVEKSSSKAIDNAAIQAIQKCKRIDIGSGSYKGAHKIQVPMSFDFES